jgi:hypothetical protein
MQLHGSRFKGSRSSRSPPGGLSFTSDGHHPAVPRIQRVANVRTRRAVLSSPTVMTLVDDIMTVPCESLENLRDRAGLSCRLYVVHGVLCARLAPDGSSTMADENDPPISPAEAHGLLRRMDKIGFISGAEMARRRENGETPEDTRAKRGEMAAYVDVGGRQHLPVKVTTSSMYARATDTQRGGGFVAVLGPASVMMVCVYPGEHDGAARAALGRLEPLLPKLAVPWSAAPDVAGGRKRGHRLSAGRKSGRGASAGPCGSSKKRARNGARK